MNFKKINIKSPGLKNIFDNIIYYTKEIINKFEKDHIWVLSSGIAFNIVISIIPFLLIALTILGIYLDSSNVLDQINNYISNILPFQGEFKQKFIMQMSERAKELTSYTFITGLLGIVGLTWTMSGLFSTMRDVLNKIYDFEFSVNYFYSKLHDFILVIITLVLFLISLTFASLLQVFHDISYNAFGEVITSNITNILIPVFGSFFISYLMFFILFRYLPQFKLPAKVFNFSTICSTILFELMKYIYAFYILKLSNFRKIYGTYAFIVVTIFWIYYISVIFSTVASLGKLNLDKNNLKITYREKRN